MISQSKYLILLSEGTDGVEIETKKKFDRVKENCIYHHKNMPTKN